MYVFLSTFPALLIKITTNYQFMLIKVTTGERVGKVCGMEYIHLSNGYKCIVDDSDYSFLSKSKWSADVRNGGKPSERVYAVRVVRVNGKPKKIYMHRVITGAEKRCEIVDHINRDTLDNRRCNLRVVDNARNLKNTGVSRTSKNKYKGVYYVERLDKYRVRTTINGKLKSFGSYSDIEEAAKKYNSVIRKHYGEDYYLNPV